MALEYARLNLAKPLRVDDLAKAAHPSTRRFARFPRRTNLVPRQMSGVDSKPRET